MVFDWDFTYISIIALHGVRNLFFGTGTVGIGGGMFSCGSYGSNCVFVKIKAEAAAFETAVLWLRKVLYQTQLDPSVLKVQAAKLLSEVPNAKRSTGAMAEALHTEEVFGAQAGTNHAPLNVIRQSQYVSHHSHVLRDVYDS